MRKALLLLLIPFSTVGQMADTTVLTLADVLDLAMKNHPIVRQAGLQTTFAEAELRTAKGQLDPKLSSSYSLKNLNDTQYYNQLTSTFKIPVWFPLDPKIEVSRNSGNYLNPENYISSSTDFWQVSTGLSLPLGKGLFIDERRALIQQSRIFGDLAEADRQKMTNTALLEITTAYWNWYTAFQELGILGQSIDISYELKEQVKLDYEYGEASVVDTVQAFITYQSRLVEFEKARLAYNQSQFALSVHLWEAHDTPLELRPDVLPSDENPFVVVPDSTGLEILLSWAESQHPEIRKIEAKKEQLEVEERWNIESLKPEVNLSYSLIDAPLNYAGTETPDWDSSYKLGVDFAFPVFLRKERGKLQKTQLYLESTDFILQQTTQEVKAGIKGTYAELKTSEKLAAEFEKMARNYQRLFEAELLNVENGESDLFKLNIQQEKYLDAQIKFVQAKAKLEKLKAYLPYSAGLPDLSYRALYE